MRPTSVRALWLIPAALALHNAEEALTFPAYWPAARATMPAVARPLLTGFGPTSFRVALIWATVIPLLVVAWAVWRPHAAAARWSALLVQAVVAVNVLSHLFASALVFHGYGPGLVTAVLVNAPLSVYLLRRATRERWLSRRALGLLVPAALLVHGPGLAGLLLLSRGRG